MFGMSCGVRVNVFPARTCTESFSLHSISRCSAPMRMMSGMLSSLSANPYLSTYTVTRTNTPSDTRAVSVSLSYKTRVRTLKHAWPASVKTSKIVIYVCVCVCPVLTVQMLRCAVGCSALTRGAPGAAPSPHTERCLPDCLSSEPACAQDMPKQIHESDSASPLPKRLSQAAGA